MLVEVANIHHRRAQQNHSVNVQHVKQRIIYNRDCDNGMSFLYQLRGTFAKRYQDLSLGQQINTHTCTHVPTHINACMHVHAAEIYSEIN